MNIIRIINELVSFKERQGDALLKVELFIRSVLESHNFSYKLNRFQTITPRSSAILEADGNLIPCRGTSFVSGKISNPLIISSLEPSRLHLYDVNININPQCEVISRPNFYFAPAVAISRSDLAKVESAKNITGEIRVEKALGFPAHIMVGCLDYPKNIIFAHYDSISRGALDNASGVAVALATIIDNPEILNSSLFVFDPNEELSFDEPVYWGHGFRVFEQTFPDLMNSCQKLIPLDCVGNGSVIVSRDLDILKLAFPISAFDKYNGKMATLYSDIPGLMKIYHSELDLPHILKEAYLKEAEEKLIALL